MPSKLAPDQITPRPVLVAVVPAAPCALSTAQRQRVRPEVLFGTWAYMAAWDVHRAKVFCRCEAKSGIAPFDRLVQQVMTQAPYRNAHRVFWIVDNGSSHRGARAIKRLQSKYSNLQLVHGPVHASWLNQIEIYFSIVQRKVLTPNDFPDLPAVAQRLRKFEIHFESIAKPFEWKFTRRDLGILLKKLAVYKLAA